MVVTTRHRRRDREFRGSHLCALKEEDSMAIKILKPTLVDTPVVTESGSPLSACHPTRRAERTTKPPTIELMNIKQAASFLGISVSTVRRMQNDRVLSVYRVAGRVMFDLFDLHEYLERRRIYATR